jgi:hypothetical protein
LLERKGDNVTQPIKPTVIVALVVILAVLGLGLYLLWDTTPPTVVLSRSGAVSGRVQLLMTVTDQGAGLKNVTVTTLQGGKSSAVLVRRYPAGTHLARESFTLGAQGLKDGPFKLQITATDASSFNFGAGNKAEYLLDYDYQNRPPAVAVLSTAHNVARGGVGLVAYTVNREVERSGVQVGDRFFPGYLQPGGFFACLFAFPYDLPAERFVPKVLVIDKAGNERLTGIYYHILPKSFRSDRIELGDSFLDKVSGEFKDRFPQATSPLEVFLLANRELRAHDLKVLADCGRQTSPTPLWEGDFLRLPNAAPRGSFAQARSYYYHGKLVDQQTHLGIDLASLAHSKVPAANRGRVVYADDLGIYGQCVIIDHGLGLQTLYGHLSRIDVKVGDQVAKGQIIGITGDTGLAGGDHLHFGVVVAGEQVNPIEWWDPSWIRNNVTDKLETAKQQAAPQH